MARNGGSPESNGHRPPIAAMAPARRPPLRRAFTALGVRDFRFLFLGTLASMFAMQMMMITRGVLAWDLTGSFAITGVLSLSFGIPMMLLSLVGGATADRVDRRTLSLVTVSGNAIIAFITGALVATDLITVPWLFTLGLIQGVIFAFMMPSRQALLADVVPSDQLMNAIALNTAVMSASSVAGPALAGGFIAFGGIAVSYFAQGVMALLAFVLMLPIATGSMRQTASAARTGVLREIVGGLRYVASSRPLLLLLIMALVPAFFAMPYQVLLPGFATHELGNRSLFPTMLTISGIGSLIGSFLLATMTELKRKSALQLALGVGMGAGLIALGLGAPALGVSAALGASFVIGFCMMGFQTLNNTMIMTTTDQRYMGRMMSIVMLTFSIGPMAGWPLGVAADHVTAGRVFIALGVTVIGFLGLMAVLAPRHMFGVASTTVVSSDQSRAEAEEIAARPLEASVPRR